MMFDDDACMHEVWEKGLLQQQLGTLFLVA